VARQTQNHKTMIELIIATLLLFFLMMTMIFAFILFLRVLVFFCFFEERELKLVLSISGNYIKKVIIIRK
jgi:predicted membrane protein